jgi:hypothetical protein
MLPDRGEKGSAAIRVAKARVPRWLLLAVGSVFVFMAGLCIPYGRAVRLDARLETTARALTLARLENTLAAAALEARRGQYEGARQLASRFFSGLQEPADELPPDVRDQIREILAHRDSAITVLSRGLAESADLLDRLLAQYREVVRAVAPQTGSLDDLPSSRLTRAGRFGECA